MNIATKVTLLVTCMLQQCIAVPVLEPELRADCVINLDGTQRPDPSPLFFRNEPGLPFAVPKYNNNVRALTVASGDSIVLLCAGNGFRNIPGDQAIATCVGGTTFTVDGNDVSFSTLSCLKTVSDVAEETGNTCENGLLEAVVGFRSTSGNLPNMNSDVWPMITICHDQSRAGTLYEKHTLNGGGVLGKDKDSSRPSFREGGFYPQITTMTVNTAYTQVQQAITIGELVGSSSLAGQYVRPNDQVFLSRGHLAPDADFCWFQGQDATYWFINVAPQWQIFNGGNWVEVENEVRGYAISRDRDVTVYTGTYDVTELADVSGNLVDIHLYLDAADPLIPVPRYFWKVLHDEVENTAVAFFGVNNPHLTSLPEGYSLCASVCDQISWVGWDTGSFLKGYTQCCTVQELRTRIPFIPDLGNVGLIKN